MADLVLENTIRVTTQNGPCFVELHLGDITKLPLEDKVDIIMVSAFPGDYQATKGTLIGALHYNLGVSVFNLAKDKEMDLRRNFHCWLSKPLLEKIPYRRLICFERQIRNIHIHPASLVGDMFRGLTPVFNNQDSTMITPLLATGNQSFSHITMMRSMVNAACNWMKAGLPLRCLKLVLFTTNYYRSEGMEDLIALFDKLKTGWERKGASLKISSVQYDVYLSYSLDDQDRVNAIKQILGQKYKDIKVFSEKQELRSEKVWQEAMFEKMTACKRIVAVLTPAYLDCADCMEQFNIAICCTRLKSIILLTPIYLETVPSMPAYMQLVQYIDCRELSDPPMETRSLKKACIEIAESIIENSNVAEQQQHADTSASYDVFISYAHRAPTEAEHFLAVLKAQSPVTKVFFDQSGLVAGKSWQKTLYNVLDRVKCVVAFITSPYIQSAVCCEEYNISLARAMSTDKEVLFIPLCVDAELTEVTVGFSGVKLLDGRGEKFQPLVDRLSKSVANWLQTGASSPLFTTVQSKQDISAISEEYRQVEFYSQFDVTRQSLTKKSFNPNQYLDVIGEVVDQLDNATCDIHFCYSQNDTRLAAILSQMIADIIPDVRFSFGAGSPQERFQKLDTSGRVVIFVCPALLESPQLVDELHMTLCRHRVATTGSLVFPVLSTTLEPHPVFLHLLPYNLCLQDKMWNKIERSMEMSLDGRRTVVVKGELQGSYSCSHLEKIALRKVCLDLAEDILKQRSGESRSVDSSNVNLVNVEKLIRNEKSRNENVPLADVLWDYGPLENTEENTNSTTPSSGKTMATSSSAHSQTNSYTNNTTGHMKSNQVSYATVSEEKEIDHMTKTRMATGTPKRDRTRACCLL